MQCYSYLQPYLFLCRATHIFFPFLCPATSVFFTFTFCGILSVSSFHPFSVPCYSYLHTYLLLCHATYIVHHFFFRAILLISSILSCSVSCYSFLSFYTFTRIFFVIYLSAKLLVSLFISFFFLPSCLYLLSFSVPCYSSIHSFLFLNHSILTVLSSVLLLVPVYHLTCRFLGECDEFLGNSVKPRYRTRPIPNHPSVTSDRTYDRHPLLMRSYGARFSFFFLDELGCLPYSHSELFLNLRILLTVGRSPWADDQPVGKPLPTQGDTDAE
jgi:hypothetical protein